MTFDDLKKMKIKWEKIDKKYGGDGAGGRSYSIERTYSTDGQWEGYNLSSWNHYFHNHTTVLHKHFDRQLFSLNDVKREAQAWENQKLVAVFEEIEVGGVK